MIFSSAGAMQFGRHVALVGEVDTGFDQRRGFDDLRTPVTRSVAEQAFQLTQRLAALPVGIGMNEIVETFGLGQVELAILKRATGKLTRFGRPDIFKSRKDSEHRRQHRASAMDVELRDILAGRTGRTWEPEHHRIVDRLLLAVPKSAPASPPVVPAPGPPAKPTQPQLAARKPARSKSRLAAGPMKGQKWFDPADASPICSRTL